MALYDRCLYMHSCGVVGRAHLQYGLAHNVSGMLTGGRF